MKRLGSRRGVSLLAMAFTLAASVAFAQNLPDQAAKAGFRPAVGKRLGQFSAKSLAGTAIESSAFASGPALFVVWSPLGDLSGQAIALASRASGYGSVVVVAVDGDKSARDGASAKGIDLSKVTADSTRLLRALGSPAAPAWIFVAPGGDVLAFKLGPLDTSAGLAAIEALFAAAGSEPGATAVKRATGSVEPSAGPASGAAKEGAALAPASPPSPARASTAESPSPIALNAGVADASFASALEREVVSELNLARTRPDAYVAILREYRKLIRGNYLERPGQVTVVLNEGAKAVDEAIAFLERQKPIGPLSLSKGLSLAAADHARDQGKTGQTGHSGSDRSTMDARIKRYGAWQKTAGENIAYGPETARDIVIQLIVDDGVSSRGHRANIFNATFAVVGVATSPHPKYGVVCVQDFAGGYEER